MNLNEIAALIPHYRLLEPLGESLQSWVFKAVPKQRPDDFCTLKLLKVPLKHESQRRYLRQKVERLKVIHDLRVITPRSFECYGDVQFVVQDHFPGLPLDQWSGRVEVGLHDFLSVAGELALALNAVHEAGIIHGGIKPHNILVRPDILAVRLIDFITPIDIREISHFIYDPGFVEGTLAYTSPEQTGRINHRVDFSTDMYSLGITFYQLLTGRLPFKSTDPLELIHSHLAEEAPPAYQVTPAIPEMVGNIVARMCLKEPEKRYQTGSGLYADLYRCSEEYRKTGRVAPFKPGLHDHTQRVTFISRMVGRDPEAEIVLAGYSKVVRGGFGSVFISGLPGIGKTRLIQELQRPLVENRGYFTSGKFDLYQKNIPYSSLLQAFRNLIRTFLTESDERVAVRKQHILTALGQQGRVITEVLPELAILIGPQPEVPTLPPVEARHRFNNLFSRFLGSLSSRDNPLVLFIDDLQWCDSATFDFLEHVFANPEDFPHLFFIGAYRHNEVDAGHALSQLMRAIQERRQPLRELRLAPLSAKACHEMVAYILDLPLEQTETLAHFLAELTEGNPLFVSESLSWLHNEQLLVFGENGQWGWDMENIRRSDMPASVVDLFGSKVRKLEAETLEILMLCACMGNRFAAEDIALIHEVEFQPLFECLKPVLSLGLLMESKTELQFVHDRVQEAVLRLIGPEQRRGIHRRIGRHLLGKTAIGPELESLENLFTIAAHLNLGHPPEGDAAADLEFAVINFHAGNKALDALATQAANEYYRTGLARLPPDAWDRHYTLSFRLHQRLAKTELMCGRYEPSETLLNELLNHAADDQDRAEALAEQTTSLSSIGNFIKAIETANRGLAYFGKAIPADAEEATARMRELIEEIHGRHGDVWTKILHMPFTGDRRSKIELAFYSELIPDLYMSGLVPQLYLSAAQSTLHCLEGGMDESVIYSFSIMGLNLGEQGQFDLAFRYEDLARDLCARYPDTFGATRGINGIVWCNMHSRSHPAEIAAYCRTGIQCGKNCGDLYNAGLSYGPLMWNLQVQGVNFRAIADCADECLEFSRKNQLSFSVGLAEAMQAGWIEPMKSASAVPVSMEDKLALWQSRNHVASAGSYFVHLALCSYYYGRYEEAGHYLEEVRRYLTGLTDNVLKRQWYLFQALNALRLHRQHPGDPKKLARDLEPLVHQVETWAALGPLLQPYLALYYSERECCFGDFDLARGRYLDAIESARRQGYTFLTGFLNESLGEWLMESGRRSGDGFLYEALRHYRRCGAQGKTIQLLERYPALFEEERWPEAAEGPGFVESLTLPNLDLDYLTKSSLALSAEIDQERLIAKIMDVVLEASGAQHGYLLAEEKEEWLVLAESHVAAKPTVQRLRRPLKQTADLCQGIIHYSCRTRANVVLADARESPEFRNLPEVEAQGLRSLLCVPLLRQAELVGVLYLENRLAAGIFTPDKVRMIELLSLQAAISMQNARLVAEIGELNAQLEQRVAERTVELEAANRELEAFSYSVSHDLRAPLRSINGFSQELSTQYGDVLDPSGQDYLQRICRASNRMGELIDDLLELSRINRSEMRRQEVNLTALAETICRECQGLQPERNIVLAIEPDLMAFADPGLIRLALENLLFNAFKFTRPCPEARIGFRRARERERDSHPVFCVTDNGVGFPMAQAGKLFNPFQRLHSPTQFEGTGIGLAIVQRIIRRHGGEVFGEGDPDKGAAFYFSL